MTSALDYPDVALVASLASYLDDMFSDYPILVLDGNERRLVAVYARTDVEIRINAGVDIIGSIGGTRHRFSAPSLNAGLSFLVAVEARRQRTNTPYLQFRQAKAQAQ